MKYFYTKKILHYQANFSEEPWILYLLSNSELIQISIPFLLETQGTIMIVFCITIENKIFNTKNIFRHAHTALKMITLYKRDGNSLTTHSSKILFTKLKISVIGE